jgi:hypothetical protein
MRSGVMRGSASGRITQGRGKTSRVSTRPPPPPRAADEGEALLADHTNAMSSSAGSEAASSKNKGGRPSHPLWNFFTRTNSGNKTGRYDAKCNFCPKLFKNVRISDFEAHLLDTDKGCKGETFTPEIRNEVADMLMKKATVLDLPSEDGRKKRKVRASILLCSNLEQGMHWALATRLLVLEQQYWEIVVTPKCGTAWTPGQ